MMRNQILRALADPGKITHTQLAAVTKRDREHQPCRIRQRPRPAGHALGGIDRESPLPQLLGPWQVKTKKIAAINSHALILTLVRTLTASCERVGRETSFPPASGGGLDDGRANRGQGSVWAWRFELVRVRLNVDVWITAIQFDGSGHEHHENISAVRWRDPESQRDGEYTMAELVDLIRAGTLVYVSDDAFSRTTLVRVVDAKSPYVRSWAQGKWGNDLLTLARFEP